jgi:hypothetical protein
MDFQGHQRTPRPSQYPNHRCKGSSYNVLVHWEDGSETFKPLTVMAKTAPITCTLYGKAHDLFNPPGWKPLKSIATREVKFTQMVKQAKFQQAHHGLTYKFGILVPKNQKDALAIDASNEYKKWQISMDTKVEQINKFDTFKDIGKGRPKVEAADVGNAYLEAYMKEKL